MQLNKPLININSLVSGKRRIGHNVAPMGLIDNYNILTTIMSLLRSY